MSEGAGAVEEGSDGAVGAPAGLADVASPLMMVHVEELPLVLGQLLLFVVLPQAIAVVKTRMAAPRHAARADISATVHDARGGGAVVGGAVVACAVVAQQRYGGR